LNFERKFVYPQKTQCAVIDKKGAAQANLIIASKGISTKDKMLPQAKIANIIFGGFFMSRLNEVLREKHGFTYGIHSNFTHRRYANTLNISSGLNTENLKKAIELINEIKQDFVSKPVTEEEFKRAVRYYTGNFNVNLETHLHISGLLKSIFLYDLKKTHYTNLLTKIRNISIDDVFDVQKKYFNSKGTVIAASGEIEKIKEQIEGYGEIVEILA
jgi:predicted Zn-dependent peptidase